MVLANHLAGNSAYKRHNHVRYLSIHVFNDNKNNGYSAIVFGSLSTVFNFNDRTFLSFTVDDDLQLAIIGFLNKILDLFVQASLKHTASILLTIWMALLPSTSPFSGASLLDFELRNELLQPWTCILNFHRRRTAHGFRALGWLGILRFAACLCTSLCVLLLALSVNTIGIPKERWLPNSADNGWRETDAVRASLTLETPRTQIQNVHWMNFWDHGFDAVGGGPDSWDMAGGLAAAEAVSMFAELPRVFSESPETPGWRELENTGYTTGINTAPGTAVQSLSVHNFSVRDLFDQLRKNRTSIARGAQGWTGRLNTTVPLLTTSCISTADDSQTFPQSGILVSRPSNGSSSFSVALAGRVELNFSSATCTISFQQALFPTAVWIIKLADLALSLHDFGVKDLAPTPLILPPSPKDPVIADGLATQLDAVLLYLDRLFNAGLAHHLVLASRRLGSLHPALLEGGDESRGLAPVLAALAQHLVTIATWDVADTGETTSSYPMRWQVYGAGPRLVWEWVAAAVLAVVLLALVGGVLLNLYFRVREGPWLESKGMMKLANRSEKIKGLEGDENEGIKVYIRADGIEEKTVIITDDGDEGGELSRKRIYT